MKALPAFIGFVVLGGVPLWLALSSLAPSVQAIARGAPVVAVWPRDAVGVPLALLCFALAAMTQMPGAAAGPGRERGGSSDRKRGGGGAAKRVDGMTICLGAAVACVLLTVVSIPLVEIGASALMAGRQYERCPDPPDERHPPMRWALAGGRCP